MTVTVILTLKGRPLHTLRWLWHHNRIAMPFPVLIADGGDDPEIEKILADPANFPNLNYKYLRYHDHTWTDYWFKMSDVMKKVDTPYAMTVDNDDFVLPHALARSADFLDANPDYASAGSHIAAFTIQESTGTLHNVAGDPLHVWLATNKSDFTNAQALDRISKPFGGSIVFFYNVNRTQLFRDAYDAYYKLDMRNLDVAEFLLDSMAILNGKIKFLSDICYFRQVGTSQNYANMDPLLTRIIFKNWVGELESMARICSDYGVRCGTLKQGAQAEHVYELLRQKVHDHFKTRVMHGGGAENPPSRGIIARLRSFLKSFALARRYHFNKKLNVVKQSLRRDGIQPVEEHVLDAALAEIVETLSSPDFPAYLESLKLRGLLPE